MKRLLLFAVGATACACLAAVLDHAVYINGKKASRDAIEQNGELYVSVSALKAAGADVAVSPERVSIQFTPPAGRNQIDAAEGVFGDWVSNESWRVRVTNIQPTANPFTGRGPGFRLTFEMRNITRSAMSPHGSGLERIQLLDEEGKVLTPSSSSFKGRYTSVAPGSGIKNELVFGDPSSGTSTFGNPEKILVLFKPMGRKKLNNIRIVKEKP